MEDNFFDKLLQFLKKVPSIDNSIGNGGEGDFWWVKFSIDIEHSLVWNVVQELGHVLNYVSIEKRLPTVFKPVSPPPYMNDGPRDFLSWVIECESKDFTPDDAAEWLEGRLHNPVNKLKKWKMKE
ncbi:MAG: hypothetical protein ACTSV5_07845 [Promethearchaeota archaeon]